MIKTMGESGTVYLAIFHDGNASYTNYAYWFQVQTAEQVSKFFNKEYPEGYYFVMADGIFHIRGPLPSEQMVLNAVPEFLTPEDGAKFERVEKCSFAPGIPVMNN